MAGYKGHLYGGLVVYACVITMVLSSGLATTLTVFEWLLFSLAGALFPDVDIKSKGQKLFYSVVCCLLVFFFYQGSFELFAVVTSLAMVPLLVNHRGLFHRTWFVILFPAGIAWSVVYYFPYYQKEILLDTIFFISGALSHLWLDFGLYRMIRQW
jgi:hypothetical protein